MPSVVRRISLATVALFAVGTFATSCSSGPNPFQAAAQSTTTVPTDGTSGDGLANNPFIPENQDLSNCVGALERPNCGSPARSSKGTYLVFLALVLGVGFIMWRIVRGVKARDAVVNAAPPKPEPGATA